MMRKLIVVKMIVDFMKFLDAPNQVQRGQAERHDQETNMEMDRQEDHYTHVFADKSISFEEYRIIKAKSILDLLTKSCSENKQFYKKKNNDCLYQV